MVIFFWFCATCSVGSQKLDQHTKSIHPPWKHSVLQLKECFFLFYSIYVLLLMLPDTIRVTYLSKSSLIN